jgi:hypothetical protein
MVVVGVEEVTLRDARGSESFGYIRLLLGTPMARVNEGQLTVPNSCHQAVHCNTKLPCCIMQYSLLYSRDGIVHCTVMAGFVEPHPPP